MKWPTGVLVLALTAMASGGAQEEKIEELRRLRKEIRGKRQTAEELIKGAHSALNEARYELAVSRHKQAERLKGEAARLRERGAALIENLVVSLVPRLHKDAIDAREEATALLLSLGPEHPCSEARWDRTRRVDYGPGPAVAGRHA